MNRNFGYYLLVAIFGLTGTIFSEDLAAPTTLTADEHLFSDLEIARKTWLETVSLYGHYSYKQTVFFTEEDAGSKEIDDKQIVAEGLICKKQDKCRLQVLYNNPPYGSPKEGFLNRSSDYIVNRNYRILYNPSQGKGFHSGGCLTQKENENLSASILDLAPLDTPFALFLNPIDYFPGEITIDSSPSYSDLGKGRAELLFSGKDQFGNKATKEIVFRINSKVPVIESIVIHYFDKDRTTTSSMIGLNWIESGGVEVPTLIREFYGPQKPANTDTNVWIVSEWKSEDLNSREPQDSDFILKLNKDEKLAGMRYIPRNRLVDLDKITDDDLLESGDLDYMMYDDGDVPNKNQGFALWIRLSLSLIAVALILFFFIARKRNKG